MTGTAIGGGVAGGVPVVEGRAVMLDGAVGLADLRNPYLVYLGALTNPETRRAMAGCLDRIVLLQARRQGRNEAGLAALGSSYGRYFPWHDLRYEHTAALVATLNAQTTGPRDRPWSPAYVNKHLTALRGVLKTCWRLELISSQDYQRATDLDPARGTRVPAGRNVTAAEFDATLDSAEADTSAAGIRDAAILAVLRTTGMRRAELAALDCGDYSVDDREIRVVGKGGRERLVPLDPDTVAYVEAWLALTGHSRGALFFALLHLPDVQAAAVAHRETPAPPLSAAAIGAIVARREAQADWARPRRHTAPTVHDYRRTLVGDLLDAGVDPATIGQITGQTVTTVMRYDRRPQAARHQAVAGLLGRTPVPAVDHHRADGFGGTPADRGEPVPQAREPQNPKQGNEPAAGRTAHRLKVSLAEARPQVWRRLELTSTAPLADLADAINTVFGWSGEHPHQFHGGHDETTTLTRVLAAPGWTARYRYGSRDQRNVDILVEAIATVRPGATYPRCTGGTRITPAEDTGIGPEET